MLNELLLAGARATPDKPVVISARGETSYAQCSARAQSFVVGLRARGITRFGCRVADVSEMIALLGASAALGVEACMYAGALGIDEITTIAAHFNHDVLITEADDPMAALPGAIVLDTLAGNASGDELDHTPDECPLLTLTTGTTGLPKGARNDWRRLVTSHQRRTGYPDARWLLAHALNQFAGLSVLTHCLVSGATLVVPEAFQPRPALAAMRDHAVTHASATPTFWRFLLGLMAGDTTEAPRLRQITLTGEAVPSALVDDLQRVFPEARITQIYGATEFGSGVAVKDAENGLPVSALERGDDADVQFKIVDGELHVRSRIGMLGYYGSDDVGDSWRPTGDLVEVRGDRVFFCGRTTEIINVGGSKVHPLPIEDAIGQVKGVELAHVYGRSNSVTGQIVAVDVVASPGVDEDELEDAIRDACASLAPASQPRRIRFVEELDIRDTKIARRNPEAQ